MNLIKILKPGSRKGLSLVTVIVILLAGTALLGAAFYLHGSFVSRSISAIEWLEDSNDMDDMVEKGKMLLEETIKDMPNFPEGKWKTDGKSIDSVLDLLVYDGSKTLEQQCGKVKISIYDLEYKSTDISISVTDGMKQNFPPAIKAGDNFRAYLIRAVEGRSDGKNEVVEVALRVSR